MWGEFSVLLCLSTVMAISSYFVGSLPLFFNLSTNRMRLLSALGTGLLVGSSLILIIPEGVEVVYSAASSHREENLHAMPFTPNLVREPHAYVGVSLAAGFTLMYLIEEIPRHFFERSSLPRRTLRVSPAEISQIRMSNPGEGGPVADVDIESKLPRPTTTTIGLVIHAAADGIALGASTSLERPALGMLVFFAIMLHKAPAAFGLTTALLKERLTIGGVRFHLTIFSLATPTAAMVTWTGINVLGRQGLGGHSEMKFGTGLVLLFSGGTFLYVAMHTMQKPPTEPQIDRVHSLQDMSMSDNPNSISPRHLATPMSAILLTMVGMLLPLFTQIGHSH